MLEKWQQLTAWRNRPGVRAVGLVLLYVAILVALAVLYGKGDFSTPSFIYQGF